MKLFPNAKINIGLNIVGKRPDGYHDLETVFYPINWCDELELMPSTQLSLQTDGIRIEGDADDNLVLRAHRLLTADFPGLPDVAIHLSKHIPTGAGLGGGSSDAAFMLKGLNDLFDLQLTAPQLMDYAVRLGADCPFFVYNQPASANGIGERLQPLPLHLHNWHILVVKPDAFVSTREAFAGITPQKPPHSIADLIRLPVAAWKSHIVNDFEPNIFRLHPEIAQLKQEMYRQGATYAAMSGSGASVYGLFATLAPEKVEWFTERYPYVHAG